MDVPPFFGMWMNTGPACIASGRAWAPRSVTGTGPAGRKPANATTPTATAPAAYLATRAYRDESRAPSRSDPNAPSGPRPAAPASSGTRSLTSLIALCRADRPGPRGYTRAAIDIDGVVTCRIAPRVITREGLFTGKRPRFSRIANVTFSYETDSHQHPV
jgi:hypothetical protein